MGLLHEKYATPHMGVLIMVIVSAVIGSVGVLGGVVTLTGITLASNLGTFALYGLICVITIVAFAGKKGFNALKHGIIPVLGLLGNVLMVVVIFVIGIISGGDTAKETYIALVIGGAWLVISVGYFLINSARKGIAILPAGGR
jgi:hypothetical protein